ncbi:MAG: hypothetical protein JXA13_12320 [Anaerolineales bacterium]|nr:hypothetical protein [Anaerolineales bacterium]
MHKIPFPYRRIVVVGTTGAGKSTLAGQLADRLNLALVELDALNWQPNWTNTPTEELLVKVDQATRGEAWVAAGNYECSRSITWTRAQAICWLDFPFCTILWRLVSRTVKRVQTRELLWGTNYERFWPQMKLWSSESVFNWFFQTYWRRKREFPGLLSQTEYSHLKVFHFKTPQETQDWLDSLPSIHS